MSYTINVEDWENKWRGSFDVLLYAQRLDKENNGMYLFKISSNYFKNSKEMFNPKKRIDYVVAHDRDEAIKTWGKWRGLINKIEKINP